VSQKKEQGFVGLEEIKKLQDISSKYSELGVLCAFARDIFFPIP